MATKSKPPQAVLVTTQARGVFFGYLKSERGRAELSITGARNCIYWHSSIGGFLGLASQGPNKECRIGARVPEITLYEITSVTECSDAAIKAWEDAKVYG